MRISSKYGLTFGFSGLIVVFATLIILSSSFTSRLALEQHARTIMENISSYTIDKSISHLDPARNAARLTLGLAHNDVINSQSPNTMASYLYEQLYLYPQISGLFFGGKDGEFIMASRYNKLQADGFFTKIIRIGEDMRSVELIYKTNSGHLIRHQFDPTDTYDPRSRPWFIKAKTQNKLIWTDPYIFYTAQKPGITVASPVRGTQEEFLGVVGVDIGLDALSTFVSELNIGKNGRAFIMGQNGDVIAYSDMEKILKDDGKGKPRLTKIIELDDPVTKDAFLSLKLPHDDLRLTAPRYTSFERDGKKYIAMFTPFADQQWPWVIGIYMPEDDYLGAIKANRTTNIYIALVTVIIALVIGFVVARKLTRARDTAELADTAKSHFLARMSHEIRTPMNALLGAGELLAETELSEEQKKYVSIYQSSGEHLRDLISDVLDISRIESGKYKLDSKPFNLHDTVIQTCQVFALDARNKEIDLDCTIASGTPEHLVGDPTALKQILVNLVGNAIKFTPVGSVTVSVDAIARRTATDVPDWVTLKFQVKDTGIGIAKDKQNSVFDRFIQADGSTSRTYGGTGLGLAICRSLVRLMSGEISMSSEQGKGSIFTFTAIFPVDPHYGAAVKKEVHTVQVKQDDSRTKRVLLVEDDERNRLLFEMFLKDLNPPLEMAESGEKALNMHTANPYDLILMDIEMPGMDGYETTRAIRHFENRNDLPATPIVAVTAHAIKEAETLCRESGCTGYLAKPVTKASLREMVFSHLGGTLNKDKEKTQEI